MIALHGTALAALLLAKGEIPVPQFTPTTVYNVPVTEPPPPEPQPLPEPPQPRPSVIDLVPPPRPLPPLSDNVMTVPPGQPSLPSGTVIGLDPGLADPPAPPLPPVRVEARMDARSEAQPPYPASEQRLGREGSVTIRVTIDVKGRVIAAEKVRATSDAFYRATEQHALRRWRFQPATLEGRPIESRKTISVQFRLTG